MDKFIRELKFAIKDRTLVLSLIGLFILSCYSLFIGLQETSSEHAMIERTKTLVYQDQEYNLAKQSDVGSAAYYVFHFSYDPPAPLAFVSRGIRDDLPWKHRLRMLALEGQIYESDTGNPELSKIGKLDFAFVAVLLFPLLIILLLFDLRAIEIRNKRWAFLSVTSGNGKRLLFTRAALRSSLLYSVLMFPFVITSIILGVSLSSSLVACAAVAFNCVFWFLLTYFIFIRIESGPTTAAILLGCWFVFVIAIPVGGKYLVEKSITVPKGGEILLSQREAVNDAWDLPVDATMNPFIESHPQWSDTPKIEQGFEWKWYYAFQQMGDERVENASKALRSGIAKRDQAMSIVALLSPTLLTDRLLAKVAKTDVTAFLNYDTCVRNFHQSLRAFHYPMLFGNVEFSLEHMENLPRFEACQ